MHRSIYFGRPKIWNRLQAPVEAKKLTELHEQMYFHKAAVNRVKEALGSYCTFLSHYKSGESHGFKAILNVKGEKKEVLVESKNFNDLEPEDYKELKDVLYGQIRREENI